MVREVGMFLRFVCIIDVPRNWFLSGEFRGLLLAGLGEDGNTVKLRDYIVGRYHASSTAIALICTGTKCSMGHKCAKHVATQRPRIIVGGWSEPGWK